jgi:NAD(P)-dependent dehydrogenase (short-subunit alcohol dehydrogenase family)
MTNANVEAHRVDLAAEAGVIELYRHIQNTGRPVDALALNAGIGEALARAEVAAVVPTVLRALRLKPLWPRRERMVLRGTTLVPHRSVPVVAADRLPLLRRGSWTRPSFRTKD